MVRGGTERVEGDVEHRARRSRALPGLLLAACAAILLAAAVPLTSSAFTAGIKGSRNTAAAKSVFTCADVFAAQRRRATAFFEYSLREDTGTSTAADSSAAGDPGTYDGAHLQDSDPVRPCPRDAGAPYRLDGSSSRVLSTRSYDPIRTDFSVEVWFKTTVPSEKILGFQIQQSANSSNYDKHLYVDDAGRLRFAIYNSDGDTSTATSPDAVDDGLWHQAVATVSSTAGTVLYLDGSAVATSPKTTAENFSGYWRIGEGNTGAWPSAPQGNSFFTGSLSFAAAYGAVLSPAEIRSAYTIGAPASVADPSPSATASSSPSATAASPSASTVSAAPDSTASLGTTSTSTQDASSTSPAAAQSSPVSAGAATAGQ